MVLGENRFKGLNSLNFVYKKGQVVRGQYFSIKYANNLKRTKFRVAVVVSKKVSKSAVVRNRIRRRLYEAIREIQTQIKQPFDIVIMVYSKDLSKLQSKELRRLLNKQLKTAKII